MQRRGRGEQGSASGRAGGGRLWGRWPAPGCFACAERGRKEEEVEGRKGRRDKKKREKEKRKRKREKEKWRERERERAVGGIRGGGRPRAHCGVRPVSDEHAE